MTRPTDAQIAAQQAVLALQDGRVALGAAFARIAAIALRQEHSADGTRGTVQVPLLDVPMRDDQPARPTHLAPVTPLFDDAERARLDAIEVLHHGGPRGAGPTGNGDADLSATALMAAPSGKFDPEAMPQTEAIPTSGRCHWRRAAGAPYCWQVITWNPDSRLWLHAFADAEGHFPHHEATPAPGV